MGRHAYGTARILDSSAARPAGRAVAQAAGDSGMSLVMVLEIESGVTLDNVAQTLRTLEATIDRNRFIRGGLLPGSKCAFGLKVHPVSVPVRTRHVHVEWEVGLTMTFHFRAAYMLDSLTDIYALIELFAEQHHHRFVLSFQYERVYAVRDEAGLDLVWKIS